MFFTNEQTARIDAICTELYLCKCLLSAFGLQKKLNNEIARCINENISEPEDDQQPCHKDGSAYARMVGE